MLGLGLGVSKGGAASTPTQRLVSAFKVRVLTASGDFEAKACLNAQLKILNNIQ